MRTKPTKMQSVTLLATLLIINFWAVPASAQPHGNQLAGSWLVEGSPDPASGVEPFTNLASMAWSGQIVNLDPNLGAATGSWERLSRKRYAITFSGFLDSDGSRYVVTAVVRLDRAGQHFDGDFHTEFLDTFGNPFFGFEGTVSGSRQ